MTASGPRRTLRCPGGSCLKVHAAVNNAFARGVRRQQRILQNTPVNYGRASMLGKRQFLKSVGGMALSWAGGTGLGKPALAQAMTLPFNNGGRPLPQQSFEKFAGTETDPQGPRSRSNSLR